MKYFDRLLDTSWISVSDARVKWVFIGIICVLWASTIASAYVDGEILWGKVVHSTGGVAWKLLMFTIFISLLQKLFPKIKVFRSLLPFRKYTGIFAFLIGLFHGYANFIRLDIQSSFSLIFKFFDGNLGMIFGLLGVFAMLLPFLTSTVWAVRVMGPKVWKNVQRLTHFAFLFTVLHLVFLKYKFHYEIDFGAFVPLGIYLVGYGYLFWKRYT